MEGRAWILVWVIAFLLASGLAAGATSLSAPQMRLAEISNEYRSGTFVASGVALNVGHASATSAVVHVVVRTRAGAELGRGSAALGDLAPGSRASYRVTVTLAGDAGAEVLAETSLTWKERRWFAWPISLAAE